MVAPLSALDAGERTELVTFERLTTTPDGMGGAALETWSVIGQAWAAVQWVGGDEDQREGGVRTLAKYRFSVLSAAADEIGITVRDRVVWGGQLFNVRERPARLPRVPITQIYAETGVAQ